MGVDLAQRLHLRRGDDPEEPVPAPQPRVDLGDAREHRASPSPWRELFDLLHRVALGALREQHLDGPGVRIYSQPESEEVTVLRAGDGRLGLVHLQTQASFDELGQAVHHPFPPSLAPHVDVAESRRRESPPPALAEPGGNLSAPRAPIVQPSGRTPNRQWANRPGCRLATSARNLRARRGRRRSRLFFRMAHLTSVSLKWRKTGYNMDL